MKRRIFAAFAAVLMLLTVVTVCGAELPEGAPELSLYPYVRDEANVLDDEMEGALVAYAAELCRLYDVDVLVLIVTSLNGMSEGAYASHYYDTNGFGRENGGFLFLVDTQNRYYYLMADGEVYRRFGDSFLASLENAVLPYLSDGDYAGAFTKYYDRVENRLAKGLDGAASTFDLSELLVPILIVLAISLLIAWAVTASMKRKMKTARSREAAHDYVRRDSFNLREKTDLYLYRTRTRVRINNNSSSGGSRSGGSGGSRGGRGGSF